MTDRPKSLTAREIKALLTAVKTDKGLSVALEAIRSAGPLAKLPPEYLWALIADEHRPAGDGRARCGEASPCRTYRRVLELLESSLATAEQVERRAPGSERGS